jgi:hypothetical protein
VNALSSDVLGASSSELMESERMKARFLLKSLSRKRIKEGD